jgi:hypothetical protein
MLALRDLCGPLPAERRRGANRDDQGRDFPRQIFRNHLRLADLLSLMGIVAEIQGWSLKRSGENSEARKGKKRKARNGTCCFVGIFGKTEHMRNFKNIAAFFAYFV